jgi:hypothetical protein
MPLLSGFQEAHRGYADRFQILGFHDATLPSLEALDHHMAVLQKRLWGGKPLSCPVLMDPSGETIRTFGIDEYPTLVLIDPEGNVLKAGNESFLPEFLDRLEREFAREP